MRHVAVLPVGIDDAQQLAWDLLVEDLVDQFALREGSVQVGCVL